MNTPNHHAGRCTSGAEEAPLLHRISKGMQYAVTGSGTARTVSELKINGAAVPNDATLHRIVTNNFLSDGGDNFAAFKNGTNKYVGGLDIDGFAKYLPTVSPYGPGLTLNRIIQK
jgi:5'-nucleotidase